MTIFNSGVYGIGSSDITTYSSIECGKLETKYNTSVYTVTKSISGDGYIRWYLLSPSSSITITVTFLVGGKILSFQTVANGDSTHLSIGLFYSSAYTNVSPALFPVIQFKDSAQIELSIASGNSSNPVLYYTICYI